MKQALALALLLIGCSKAPVPESINPTAKFFCLAPAGYEIVGASDPGVTVGETYIQIVREDGVFFVPRSICVQAIPK